MKLSIIMPVYNEEKTIAEIIKKVEDVKIKDIEKEIIVVEDYSKDNTRNVLKNIRGKNVKIFFHEKNRGKGAAIRTGLSKSTGDVVIIQDADLEYNPEEYKNLLKAMKEENARVIYGSRAMNKGNKHSYLSYYLGNIFLNICTNLLFFASLTDMETCYKLIDRKLMQDLNLKSDRFDIEPEITAKILKRGIKIHEIPISYNPRSKNQGKKIKWKDGISAILTLVKYRFKN